MEFINQKISFSKRIYNTVALPIVMITLFNFLLIYIAKKHIVISSAITFTMLLVILYELHKAYKDCTNWIEYFSVDEKTKLCKLRLFQKNILHKEIELPQSNISCKLRAESRGKTGSRYFLEIYYNNEYLFDVSDAIISRYKLQEILKYFNNETTR